LNINTYLLDGHLTGTISNDLQLQKNKVISNPESDLHNLMVGAGCMMNKKQPINPPAGSTWRRCN